MTRKYDALIVGAGHNGLTCGAYLARAGKRVLVLERKPVIGGASVTEEFSPGFRASTYSFIMGHLHPKVITELDTEMPRAFSIAIQSDRVRRRSPRAFTAPARWMAPPNSSSFSVSVVLPASGCEMMAKVRRLAAPDSPWGMVFMAGQIARGRPPCKGRVAPSQEKRA